MKPKMFIDDERFPVEDEGWVIVRTFDDFQEYLSEYGFPEFVSFDHDLGEGEVSGHFLAKFLVELDLNKGTMPKNFSWYVHSQNPIGRDNINGLLTSYMRSKL